MKKFFNNLIFILAVCFFIFALYYSIEYKNNPKSYVFGYKFFMISTASMEPEYPVYSLVVVKNKPVETIVVGDTIAFTTAALNGKVAFHRVVEIRPNGFITKGDNNNAVDQFIVSFDEYVGTGVFHSNIVATCLTLYYQYKTYVLVLIFSAGVVVVILALKKLFIKDKKRSDYSYEK